MVIEDFNGSGRIALFGEEWAKWQGMLREGYTVFIRAKCSQRFKDSKFFDFRIADIKLLQTVKEESIDKITLHVKVNDLNEELVDDLMSIVSTNKGSTQLFLQVNDHINNTNFLMRAREREIELTHDFLSYIEQHENISYTVN